MKREFKASLWREDDWVIAQCLDIDIASQGRMSMSSWTKIPGVVNV